MTSLGQLRLASTMLEQVIWPHMPPRRHPAMLMDHGLVLPVPPTSWSNRAHSLQWPLRVITSHISPIAPSYSSTRSLNEQWRSCIRTPHNTESPSQRHPIKPPSSPPFCSPSCKSTTPPTHAIPSQALRGMRQHQYYLLYGRPMPLEEMGVWHGMVFYNVCRYRNMCR